MAVKTLSNAPWQREGGDPESEGGGFFQVQILIRPQTEPPEMHH